MGKKIKGMVTSQSLFSKLTNLTKPITYEKKLLQIYAVEHIFENV